jgi:hypothetical protein
MKTAYISPDKGVLEITVLAAERPEALVTLDMGIPHAPAWVLRVPVDHEDGWKILDMSIQALAEDFLKFLVDRGFQTDLAMRFFSGILEAYKSLKEDDSPLDEGGAISLKAEIALDEDFVNEVHKTIVVAAIKRTNPVKTEKKPVRRLEVSYKPPKGKALSEAQKIIQKYRNRPLTGMPKPWFITVYDFNGRPVGVKRLGSEEKV